MKTNHGRGVSISLCLRLFSSAGIRRRNALKDPSNKAEQRNLVLIIFVPSATRLKMSSLPSFRRPREQKRRGVQECMLIRIAFAHLRTVKLGSAEDNSFVQLTTSEDLFIFINLAEYAGTRYVFKDVQNIPLSTVNFSDLYSKIVHHAWQAISDNFKVSPRNSDCVAPR